MLDNKLTEDKIAEIKDNFNFFDRDNNGRIDDKEFAELLKVIEPKTTNKEIENGFSIVDKDGNGTIDFSEFLAWWEQCWWQY